MTLGSGSSNVHAGDRWNPRVPAVSAFSPRVKLQSISQPSCPEVPLDDVLLVVGELVTNAVLHANLRGDSRLRGLGCRRGRQGAQDRGVVFEEYDMPGLKTMEGIAEIQGVKGAWFKDPDGNILPVAERTT